MHINRDGRYFPGLHEDAPDVPPGKMPAGPGIKYGCGDADCPWCYISDPQHATTPKRAQNGGAL